MKPTREKKRGGSAGLTGPVGERRVGGPCATRGAREWAGARELSWVWARGRSRPGWVELSVGLGVWVLFYFSFSISNSN